MPTALRLHKVSTDDAEFAVANDELSVASSQFSKAVWSFQFSAQSFDLKNGKYSQNGKEISLADLQAKLPLPLEDLKFPFVLQGKPTDEIWQAVLSGKQLEVSLTAGEKIALLEEELAGQRQLDQLRLDKDKLQKEINEAERQMDSVSNLTHKLQQCETELSKLQSRPLASSSQLQLLKQLVIQNLRNQLGPARISQVMRSVKEYVTNMPIWPLVAMAGVTFGVGAAAGIALRDIQLISMGLIFAILEAGMVILLLSQHQSSLPVASGAGNITLPSANTNQVDNFLAQNHFSDLTSAFVDSALAEAYQTEIANLKKTISEQLPGADVDKLQADLLQKQTQLEQIKQKLTVAESKLMTPDVYLRKRRELDLLKMEKRRAEYEGKDEERSLGWKKLANYIISSYQQNGNVLAEELKQMLAVPELAAVEFSLIENKLGQMLLRLFTKVSSTIESKFGLWPLMITADYAADPQLGLLRQSRQIILLR